MTRSSSARGETIRSSADRVSMTSLSGFVLLDRPPDPEEVILQRRDLRVVAYEAEQARALSRGSAIGSRLCWRGPVA